MAFASYVNGREKKNWFFFSSGQRNKASFLILRLLQNAAVKSEKTKVSCDCYILHYKISFDAA